MLLQSFICMHATHVQVYYTWEAGGTLHAYAFKYTYSVGVNPEVSDCSSSSEVLNLPIDGAIFVCSNHCEHHLWPPGSFGYRHKVGSTTEYWLIVIFISQCDVDGGRVNHGRGSCGDRCSREGQVSR